MNYELTAWVCAVGLVMSTVFIVTMLSFVWLPSTINDTGYLIVYTNLYGERDLEIVLLAAMVVNNLFALVFPLTYLLGCFDEP